MAYNKPYNTRQSGRYNNSGQFVSAGELVAGAAQQCNNIIPPRQSQQDSYISPQPSQPQQPNTQIPRKMPQQNLQLIQTTEDVDMKPMDMRLDLNNSLTSQDDSNNFRPHWMKSKLPGVKKISNKERRRRQNENLRRLLTPKNALMVLNEMMPNEQIANQFRVEPANNNQFYKTRLPSFCADLTLDGNNYKGYGENKLTARNAAAEQAIRDLIIKKMSKALANDAASSAGGGEPAEAEEALPMLQLASFALHKLFAEWEYEGHKVPHLKPRSLSVSEPEAEADADADADAEAETLAPAPRARGGKKPKELPANAAAMHPCMLLTYLRPHMEYRELTAEGDRPQNMVFTMGVDVDGATYIGKASNKKEARKAAARAACHALFGVTFDTNATANTPVFAQ